MEPKTRDEILGQLHQELENDQNDAVSWVRGPLLPDDGNVERTKRCRFFDKYGFIFIPSFAHESEMQSMKKEMEDLVQNEWKPESIVSFRTDQKQIEAQGKSDYFLDSATKIHYFAEKDAMDPNKNGELKEEYQKNKIAALNKAGHGMHLTPGPYQTYAKSPKVAKLLRELGWVDPVVPQSMYIFKQARIGGEVTSHQDSTFLFTTPRQTCIGLWLALDDATLENGCLWVRPGSHREAVRRQFVRNPLHFGESLCYGGDESNIDGEKGTENGDQSQPQMIFRDLNPEGGNESKVIWEGKLPEDSMPMPECTGLYKAGFVPVPCKAGDLLAFAGELDHLSLPNFSSMARHTFQLHCVEGERAGVQWSKENWMQYPPDIPFMRL